MEDQARQLLAVVTQPRVPVDTKLDLIEKLKSHIKHHAVPESAVAPTFDVIRAGLSFSQLHDSAFSVLSHMTKRMLLQNQHELLASEAAEAYSIILERLGDGRDRTQARAVQALSDLWQVAPHDVDGLIRDDAMHSTRSRTRRGGMQWVLRTHKDHGLPFKGYVPQLVQFLNDPDPGARETARGVLVELFRSASDPAKADLQKQLARSGADTAAMDAILGSIGLGNARPGSSADSRGQDRMTASAHSARMVASHSSTGSRDNIAPPKGKKSNSVPPGIDSADALPPPVAASTKAELDPAKAIQVGANGQFVLTKHLTADNKDTVVKLEDVSRDFMPAFEGRETEQNWPMRDKHILTLRKLNHGNAPTDFTATFVAQLKGMREGILKAVNTLRTTPSTNACYLIQELARTLGSGLDPMVEVFMEALLKLAGHTKIISAQNANVTITTLYNHASYHKNLLIHISSASTDKNVRPRGFAQGWLKAIISRHVNHRHVLEHGSGLDSIEKVLKKGLADPDPGVRDSARDAYWSFNPLWPSRGEVLMASLATGAQNQLLQHKSNPDKSTAATQVATSKSPFSKSTNASGRPTLKEAMLAKKREKERLERPASALASTSPVRSHPPRPQSSLATGTLSSAPLRPVRPKPAKRPAPTKPESPKTTVKIAARRPLPPSPAKASSPVKADEDLTIIMPSAALGASAELPSRPKTSDSSSSRPKTADSSSTASASASRRLDPPFEPEPSHTPAFGSPQAERPVLADSPAAEEVMSASVPETFSQQSVDEPDVTTTPTELALADSTSPAEPVTRKEDRKPEPIVIRDEEQHKQSHPANGSGPTSDQKLSDRSAEVGSLGERPLAELSDSQTNNVLDVGSPSTMRLIDSGIKRISSKTLDAHGFRKLQSTVTSNLDALPADKLEALVRAVIPQIGDDVSPSDDRILTQQQLLLKTLSKSKKVSMTSFLPEAVCSVLAAMGRYEEQSHTQVTLEGSFDDFAGLPDLPLQDVLDAALAMMAQKQAAGDAQSVRTLGHAFDGVGKLLQAQGGGKLGEGAMDAVLRAALLGIKNLDASIRKKAYGLAAQVYKATPDHDRFWADVEELPAPDKAMLHYMVKD